MSPTHSEGEYVRREFTAVSGAVKIHTNTVAVFGGSAYFRAFSPCPCQSARQSARHSPIKVVASVARCGCATVRARRRVRARTASEGGGPHARIGPQAQARYAIGDAGLVFFLIRIGAGEM
jgi:hypothetical protein